MAGSATTALNYALKYIGTKESPANSNRGPKIDEWQRAVDMIAQPWCGAFTFACLSAAGVKGLSPRMRYCPYIVEDAKAGRNGLLKVVKWDDKRPGDLIVFQWDSGAVDHVGILVSTISSTVISTIEGNTSVGDDSNGGQVMRRTRLKGTVAAIVRPRYGANVPLLSPCEFPGITLSSGSKGSAVKVVQGWINTLDDAGYVYSRLKVDGDYGAKTVAQVKLYQGRHKLVADGVTGPLTWRALCASVRAAK